MADRPYEALLCDTLRAIRRVIGGQTPSEDTVPLVVACLHELGQVSGLKEAVPLRPLHRGTAAGNVLASEGPQGITLFIARLSPETPTPIHDHGTWGIAYVVEGRSRYLRWSVSPETDRSGTPGLQRVYDRILGPGSSEWYVPPEDIHCQQGDGDYAWELVAFGRDVTRFPRRYFDPETGRTTIIQPE
jgi:predicted metal-dependent enzyme (double-stranded beta helix superfamily)